MKAATFKLFNYLLLLSGLLLLSACGGGSSTNTNNNDNINDSNTPPINNDGTYSVTSDIKTLNFSANFFETSTQTKDVQITFEGDGLLTGFASANEVVNWLAFETVASTENTRTIRFSIKHVNTDTQTGLPPNNYKTKFRLTTGNIASNTLVSEDIEINLVVWPTSFNFQGIETNSAASQTLTLNAVNFPWNITKSENLDWLNISNETTNGIQTISFTPDTSSFSNGGKYSGSIIINQEGTSQTTTVPVSLFLDDARLYTNASGVGLFQLSDSKNLSETINVLSNTSNTISWQATTNANWLTLTADNISNTLQITKNDNVINDGQHFSQVTIQSTTNGVTAQQIIHVGYYQSANAKTITTLEKLDGDENIFDIPDVNRIVFDPIRPLFYLTDDSSLTSYHLFTGEKVNEIALPTQVVNGENIALVFSNLAMSPNGQFLLASAITIEGEGENKTEQLHVYQLDLSNNTFTGTNLTELTLSGADKLNSLPIYIGQISGHEVVITNKLQMAEINNNSVIKLYNAPATLENVNIPFIQQANSTNELFFVQTQTNNGLATQVILGTEFTYHQYTDNKINLTDFYTISLPTENTLNFFDVSEDGDTIYTAQLGNEIITLSQDNEPTFEGEINTNNQYEQLADVTHALNGHSYYYHLNNTTPLTFSITEYDEQLIQVGEPNVIPNASDSSFILPTYKRLITREPSTAGSNNEWFITSFN